MIEICCPRCKGEGKVQLGSRHMRTLGVIEGEMTATEVHEILQKIETDKNGITAMNNRLNALMELGFLKRRRDKKQWLYRRVEE